MPHSDGFPNLWVRLQYHVLHSLSAGLNRSVVSCISPAATAQIQHDTHVHEVLPVGAKREVLHEMQRFLPRDVKGEGVLTYLARPTTMTVVAHVFEKKERKMIE